MRVWWTTAYYELVKISRMRSVLAILIGMPLLLILLLGSAFDTEIKQAKVVVFNADQGDMKASIDTFWQEADLGLYIEVLQAKSANDVQDWVREGLADYGVSIPSAFSEKVRSGNAAEWLTFEGRYAEKNIAAEAAVNRYMSSVNLQLAAIRLMGAEQAAEAFGQAGTSASNEAAIAVHNLGMGNSRIFGETTAIQYYSATYLIMFLLYGGMTAVISLINQRESGTLHRLYAIPSSFRIIVFGIVFGACMLAALQAIVVILFTTYVYDVNWGGHYGAIALICLLATAAGVGLAITVASFVHNKKSTQTMFSIIVLSMTFLSGGMVTGIENMVGGANKLTINHWASSTLRAIMNGSSQTEVWQGIGVLSLIALGLLIVAVVRLPKVVKRHA
ncbi:ABC transporter permease [Paenibacillus sinopodophylli]|uniref:ABC transporter permease n=1 Tax=Paenibacillus sinopodophylli TaxID=1837342 RepID=UPI00110C9F5E|nr:ABC transporter permease [Paenibacillus sinopodophylli]